MEVEDKSNALAGNNGQRIIDFFATIESMDISPRQQLRALREEAADDPEVRDIAEKEGIWL